MFITRNKTAYFSLPVKLLEFFFFFSSLFVHELIYLVSPVFNVEQAKDLQNGSK